MHHASRLTLLAAATAAALATLPAQAQTYGYLANFDAINNTGHTAYGFEIELEGEGFDHSKITSVFGYDRDFGLDSPADVVRYGAPTITDRKDALGNAIGVLIRYGGTLGGPFTLDVNNPAAIPFGTGGDSCWPFGAGWSAGTACDHFGVSTLGQPTNTKYSWLVESTPGTLTAVSAGIPAVNFAYTPPAAGGGGGGLRAEIEAEAPEYEQPENEGVWGEAYWVKVYTTKVDHDIHLGNLFRDDPMQEAAEIETEWELLQRAPAGEEENGNGRKAADLVLAEGDQAVMRRYEFYEYIGPFKADGEADCSKGCGKDPEGDGLVGKYLGAQMAGFNVNDPQAPIALAPIPEPQTYAMLGIGLGILGLFSRRRR